MFLRWIEHKQAQNRSADLSQLLVVNLARCTARCVQYLSVSSLTARRCFGAKLLPYGKVRIREFTGTRCSSARTPTPSCPPTLWSTRCAKQGAWICQRRVPLAFAITAYVPSLGRVRSLILQSKRLSCDDSLTTAIFHTHHRPSRLVSRIRYLYWYCSCHGGTDSALRDVNALSATCTRGI